MLKSKMICGRKSAWVYKNFEMDKIYYLEQNIVCVLSFNYIDKIQAALFYHYLFYIMLGTLVVLYVVTVCYLCTHIAEFWKGTLQIKCKKMYEWLL